MFTNWDIEEYENELFNTALDCPESLTNVRKGHALDLHTDKTDMQLLSRMVKENKSEASAFSDLEDYSVMDRIGDAIASKAPEIADWACSKRNEFSDPREYHQLIFDASLGCDEPIGYGFKSDLEKYATDTIRIVLQRDNSGENQFGFYMLTAYPNIDKGEPTGIRYEENDLIKGRNELTVLEKMKLGLNGYPVETRISYDPLDGKQQLILCKVINKEESYVAYMNESKLQIKYKTMNSRKTISKENLQEKCPELASAINKAELFRDVALAVKEKQKQESQEIYPFVQKTCNKDKDALELS